MAGGRLRRCGIPDRYCSYTEDQGQGFLYLSHRWCREHPEPTYQPTPGDATDGAADGDAVHLDALARPDCGPQRCGDSRAGDGNHHDKFGGFTGEQIINRQHNGGPVFRRFSGPTGTECDQP
ncbi:hypothetical protein MPHO_39700 [Mycolicibacterium phocaicum]|uniref:Uncharacterized protein n=1 Tax=Mycolicibacterium mucogenicum TaxID=56689 RepID=A0A1A0LPU1_MYCMU|nr:hypothetical protein A5642_08255 [Mycolicibacterium mucogenicum]BBZ56978.1 hypothetical protein MPHO_39700 [Mycolicibacterium phocaicum]